MAKTPMIFAAVENSATPLVKPAYTVPAGKYAIVNVHLAFGGHVTLNDGVRTVTLKCPAEGSGAQSVPAYQGLVCPAGTVIAGLTGGHSIATGFLYDL